MTGVTITPQQRPRAIRRHRRRVGTALWVAALVIPAPVAYALWSVTGTGSGTARASTVVALTVGSGTATADLYPGAAGNVAFSVTNPNTFPVSVTAGTITSVTAVTGAAGSCSASDFTVGTGTVVATPVAAGATATVVLVGALTMKTTAGDGCQGAVLTVSGAVTGSQS